jgi:hypothetical protein
MGGGRPRHRCGACRAPGGAGRLSLWLSYLTRREPDLTPEKATLLSSELLCSSEKAERELGYRGVPLQTMLEDCHRWLLAEGLLER